MVTTILELKVSEACGMSVAGSGEGSIRTFSVDCGFNLLQPARLDVVSEFLHSRLDITDFDSVFVLLVERVECIPCR